MSLCLGLSTSSPQATDTPELLQDVYISALHAGNPEMKILKIAGCSLLS
jgi:hypothetical protein